MQYYEGFFDEIYEHNRWGNGSGRGSIPHVCKKYIKFIEIFIKRNNIKHVLDIGCGDWQFSQYINWQNAKYTGIDVVESVIDKNKETFEKSGIEFINTDIFGLEEWPYDLVLCKDVFQHLPLSEIKLIMDEVVYEKKTKHYIITNETFRRRNRNQNDPSKRARGIDLTKTPFAYKAFNIQLLGINKITQYK